MAAKQIGKRSYQVSLEVREIAEKVIKSEKLNLGKARVEYILVSPGISKRMAGRCIRSGSELKFFSDFDYLVEISDDLWHLLPLEVKEHLVHHELKHVMIALDKDGNEVYQLQDHDVKDFAELIERFGINWLSTVRSSMKSAYKLSPEDERKIRI